MSRLFQRQNLTYFEYIAIIPSDGTRFLTRENRNFQSPKSGEEKKMDKYCFDALVAYGVHGVRISVGASETVFRESAKWLQMFRDAQELILASSKPGRGKGSLSLPEIRKHLSVLRHIPAHH